MLKYSIKIIIFYLLQKFKLLFGLLQYIYIFQTCVLSITKCCSNFCFVFICSRPSLANFVKNLGFFKTLLLKGTLKCLQSIFMSYWTKGWVINIYSIDRLNLSILAIHWEFWDITKRKFCKIISSLKENLLSYRKIVILWYLRKMSSIVVLSIDIYKFL